MVVHFLVVNAAINPHQIGTQLEEIGSAETVDTGAKAPTAVVIVIDFVETAVIEPHARVAIGKRLKKDFRINGDIKGNPVFVVCRADAVILSKPG